MSVKLDEERYLVNENSVGLDDRFWFDVVPVAKWWPWSKPKYKLEIITAHGDGRFSTQKEAIEFAKHTLWCLVKLIKR